MKSQKKLLFVETTACAKKRELKLKEKQSKRLQGCIFLISLEILLLVEEKNSQKSEVPSILNVGMLED